MKRNMRRNIVTDTETTQVPMAEGEDSKANLVFEVEAGDKGEVGKEVVDFKGRIVIEHTGNPYQRYGKKIAWNLLASQIVRINYFANYFLETGVLLMMWYLKL